MHVPYELRVWTAYSSIHCGLTADKYGKMLSYAFKVGFSTSSSCLSWLSLLLAWFLRHLKVLCIMCPGKQNYINKCKHILEISNDTDTLSIVCILFFSFSRYIELWPKIDTKVIVYVGFQFQTKIMLTVRKKNLNKWWLDSIQLLQILQFFWNGFYSFSPSFQLQD